MGNSFQTQCRLTNEEIQKYTEMTVFTEIEVCALWCHYDRIAGGTENLSRKQFQGAMLFRDSSLLDRFFHVVDRDDDNHISFSEYLVCLSSIPAIKL